MYRLSVIFSTWMKILSEIIRLEVEFREEIEFLRFCVVGVAFILAECRTTSPYLHKIALRAAPSARRAPRACLYSRTCNSIKTSLFLDFSFVASLLKRNTFFLWNISFTFLSILTYNNWYGSWWYISYFSNNY